MDERAEQNLHEIGTSLESTIEWMRKRQPGDWAKVQVPGEPHRYGTMHLYLLLRIEALLREMNARQSEQQMSDAEALQTYKETMQEYKMLLEGQKQEKRPSRRRRQTKEQEQEG